MIIFGAVMVGIKEIAREAGVSKTTVSFVLNRRSDMRISDAVTQRVLEVATRLGYVRNDLVRAVVKGESRVIAIVAQFHDFMMPIIRGYADEAAGHGYSIRMIPVDDDINRSLWKVLECRAQGVAGLGLSQKIKSEISPSFFRYKLPSLGLDKDLPPGALGFDQIESAKLALEYLVAMGHRRIFCVYRDSEITRLRIAGYENVMTHYGLKPVTCIVDELLSEEAKLDDFLSKAPTAVFGCDDASVLRLMQKLYQCRIFIPDALSIMGFGNTIAGALSSPPLTTIDEPYYETGRDACSHLISQIETGEKLPVRKYVGKLIVRASTAKIHGEKQV